MKCNISYFCRTFILSNVFSHQLENRYQLKYFIVMVLAWFCYLVLRTQEYEILTLSRMFQNCKIYLLHELLKAILSPFLTQRMLQFDSDLFCIQDRCFLGVISNYGVNLRSFFVYQTFYCSR